MKAKKHIFSIILFCFCILLNIHANAATHHKKTKKVPAKKRAHTVQPLIRPDLKIVHTTAQPVWSLMSSISSDYKNKTPNNIKDMSPFTDPREALYNDHTPLNPKISQIDWSVVENKKYTKNGKVYLRYKNYIVELTIKPEMQEAAERFLTHSHAIISGSTAIIEPHTGRILALAQGGNKANAATSVSSEGPAASLIKIVTSAAAIEKSHLGSNFELAFRGGCGTLARENWIESPARDNLSLSFDKAFGSSCNTFFARLALYHVGLASLKTYAEKFMFNKPIPSDIKIQTSLFLLPDAETATPQEIAEAGSGFGATKLSPIHAALLSAAVANGGIMMAPHVIEAAYNLEGKEVYRAQPIQIGRVVSKETADTISVLMLATTAYGTSRRAFHKRGTQANIEDIGGKTGTLLDLENRQVLYTWFSGIASINSPNSIAIGTVIASPQNYIIRANAVAQTTLAEYFKLQNLESMN